MRRQLLTTTLLLLLSLVSFSQTDSDNTLDLSLGFYTFDFYPGNLGKVVNPGLNLTGLINLGNYSAGISSDVVPSIFSPDEADERASLISFRGIYKKPLVEWESSELFTEVSAGVMFIDNVTSPVTGLKLGYSKWFPKGHGIQVYGSYNRLTENSGSPTSNLYSLHLGYIKRFVVEDFPKEGIKEGSISEDSSTLIAQVSPIDTLPIMDFLNLPDSLNSLDPMVWETEPDLNLVTSITDTVYFGFDSDELTAESQAKIDSLIKFKTVTGVYTEGYTDNVGPASYNLTLAQRRAEAVGNYIVNQSPVNSEAVINEGYEEKDAPFSNDTLTNRKKNRCTILSITYQI